MALHAACTVAAASVSVVLNASVGTPSVAVGPVQVSNANASVKLAGTASPLIMQCAVSACASDDACRCGCRRLMVLCSASGASRFHIRCRVCMSSVIYVLVVSELVPMRSVLAPRRTCWTSSRAS